MMMYPTANHCFLKFWVVSSPIATLLFLHHKENAPCCKESQICASLAAVLFLHSRFFSHGMKLRGLRLPLSAVTVSRHYLPQMSAFKSHMRQNAYYPGLPICLHQKSQTYS